MYFLIFICLIISSQQRAIDTYSDALFNPESSIQLAGYSSDFTRIVWWFKGTTFWDICSDIFTPIMNEDYFPFYRDSLPLSHFFIKKWNQILPWYSTATLIRRVGLVKMALNQRWLSHPHEIYSNWLAGEPLALLIKTAVVHNKK